MYKQTKVTPREHYVDNFGTDVQAITFSYNGVVHSINRRGKRNILGFIGASGTYTFTAPAPVYSSDGPQESQTYTFSASRTFTVPSA